MCSVSSQIGEKRVHRVRTRGGNSKFRALRLDSGSFSWASEGIAAKTRVIDVVYNASNNELVRTKTLVKNAIVVIDATPFRQWYENHYILPLGRKREAKKQEVDENDIINKKRSKKAMSKYLARQKYAKVDSSLEEQFSSGRLLGTFINNLVCRCNLSILSDVIRMAIHKILAEYLVLRNKPLCDMIMLS